MESSRQRKPEQNTNRASHVTSVKIVIAIFLQFVLSILMPNVLYYRVGKERNFYWFYLVFFNNIGNAFVYYVVNKHFRKEVNKLLKKLYNKYRCLTPFDPV